MPDIHALRPVPDREHPRALRVAQEGQRPETDRDTRLTLVVVVVICNGLLGATLAVRTRLQYSIESMSFTIFCHPQPEMTALSNKIPSEQEGYSGNDTVYWGDY